MKVAIVGLGLIGASIARDLKRNSFASEIIGVDSSEKHALEAQKLGLVDQISSLDYALGSSDLLILAVPMDVLDIYLPRILSLAPPHTTITDMGSTKQQLGLRVAGHPKREQYVAAHPMAGTENSGPGASLNGLFVGKTAVICDQKLSSPEHLAKVVSLFECLGMRIVYMSAESHDLHAAYVSHLSHISSFVLANTVLEKNKDVETIFNLAGGGFESTVRLAKSSPPMWAPIFEQNKEPILLALKDYIDHLQKFYRNLENSDTEALTKSMQDANAIRPILQNLFKAPENK